MRYSTSLVHVLSNYVGAQGDGSLGSQRLWSSTGMSTGSQSMSNANRATSGNDVAGGVGAKHGGAEAANHFKKTVRREGGKASIALRECFWLASKMELKLLAAQILEQGYSSLK